MNSVRLVMFADNPSMTDSCWIPLGVFRDIDAATDFCVEHARVNSGEYIRGWRVISSNEKRGETKQRKTYAIRLVVLDEGF